MTKPDKNKTKICTHCKAVNPITEFSKRKSSSDGLAYICKKCAKGYNQGVIQRKFSSEQINAFAWDSVAVLL